MAWREAKARMLSCDDDDGDDDGDMGGQDQSAAEGWRLAPREV